MTAPDPGGGAGPPAAGDRASGRHTEPERLEAFSDGVLAVVITIMVLELKSPAGPRFADLRSSFPGLLAYILSFAFVGIYWNNHHHLLRSTRRISGSVMWANLHLLFWVSLVPVVTEWVGRDYKAHLPASVYGVVCLGSALAYSILVLAIIGADGTHSRVARAIGRDRKGRVSIAFYLVGIGAAWISPWISYSLFATVSLIWFLPDRRLEQEMGAG